MALRESLLVYPLIESAHVLGLMLFLGPILMLDIDLLGKDRRLRYPPWTVVFGLVIMLGTGTLLFYAAPVRTFHSIWFRLKIGALVMAAVNVIAFYSLQSKRKSTRVFALISLGSWFAIVMFGRLIAYDWYDCHPAQNEFVRWFAQCP